jgi:hypothetical protein
MLGYVDADTMTGLPDLLAAFDRSPSDCRHCGPPIHRQLESL